MTLHAHLKRHASSTSRRARSPASQNAHLRTVLAALLDERDALLIDPPPRPADSSPQPKLQIRPATLLSGPITSSSAVHSFSIAQMPFLTIADTTTTTTLPTAPVSPTQPPTPAPPTQFPSLAAAQAIVHRHIRLLHAYNAIRDIGQGLLGLVAEQRGVRVVDVMRDFGAGVDD